VRINTVLRRFYKSRRLQVNYWNAFGVQYWKHSTEQTALWRVLYGIYIYLAKYKVYIKNNSNNDAKKISPVNVQFKIGSLITGIAENNFK